MSKKDYVEIAKAIAWTLNHHCDSAEQRQSVHAAAEEIATKLQQDNPRFNRHRFLEACGVQP